MEDNILRPLLAEFVGTFALIFVGAGSICLASIPGQVMSIEGIALANGLILAVMVSATMNVSGGHINPAISISSYFTGHINGLRTFGYVISQLFGAVFGAYMLRMIFPSEVWTESTLGATTINYSNIGFLESMGGSPYLGAIFLEAILTYFLVFVFYGTVLSEESPSAIGGLAVGLTFAANILVGGPLTGASMNPARTFGPAFAGGFWASHLVFWIGPILGALLAGINYESFIGTRKA